MPRSLPFLLLAALLAGCSPAASPPPNVLWIVWDTVRADHLSLYGYPRPTTPYLDAWSRQARVFDDCLSPGTITLTSHGSLFTGLAPSEHGADNGRRRLGDRHVTFAEHLKAAGYRTFLWSANPHISADANFDQGFDVSRHPWSDEYQQRAQQIVRDKIAAEDKSSELPPRLAKAKAGKWDVKASGSLAREVLSEWLAGDADAGGEEAAPYFAFLNYMEAHRPRIPPAELRARMMSPEDVARSYAIDQSWDAIWSYSFGLGEYTPEELRIMTATYDAAIAELDELLRDLIDHLEAEGRLDNTVVVVTSDHGEHLGEHHLLDHQYSVYEPLARVPLVLSYPGIAAGRESRPVMSHDLFPTLLELCGIDPGSDGQRNHARGASLLNPRPERPRLTEYLKPFRTAFRSTSRSHPDWDPEPWEVGLRALTLDRRKLIRDSNGRVELYDLDADPSESKDLAPDGDPGRNPDASRLGDVLDRQIAVLEPWSDRGPQPPRFSPEHNRRLQALGYLDGSEVESSATGPSTTEPPAGSPADVIFIVVDTLRADHLGFSGYSRPTSPQLDWLAAESIIFDRAFAQAPWTSPSVASLLTSRYPGTLGYADSKDPAVVEDDALLLAEILAERGYRTHAVVSHTYVGSPLGFDQGMSTFDEGDARGPLHVSSASVTDKAIALLDGAGAEPLFLLLHYFDPHFSYLLHEGFDFDPDYRGDVKSGERYGTLVQRAREQTLSEQDVEYIRALYDSEIRFTDLHLGRLLQHLRDSGRYDDAVIVFTADHGEAFLDRNDRWIGHGKTLFGELIHVPLLFKLPEGKSAGTRVATPVALVDVVPSLLDVLGLPAPPDSRFEGRTLPLAAPEALHELAAEPVYSETMARQRWLQSIVLGRWKLIADRKSDRLRLFDLEADPGERRNLAKANPETALELAETLNAWSTRIGTERRAGATPSFSAEELERLRALGYLP